MTETLDCDHVDMLVVKGHILLANNRLEDAEKMFKHAMKQSKNSTRTLMRIIVSIYDNHFVDLAYHMFLNLFAVVGKDWNEGYAYMALCCYDLKHDDEFMLYLKKACDLNPQEARAVLGHLFPTGMKADDYYKYMNEKLKK